MPDNFTVLQVPLEEDLLPHVNCKDSEEQMEEERRLCYVGITRAKKQLYLTHARQRFLWGGRRFMRMSRFLRELPSDCVQPCRRGGFYSSPSGERSRLSSCDEELQPGEAVRHKTYGLGIILRAYKGSLGQTYEILFKGIKTPKHIVAKYAELQHCGSVDS